MIKKLDNGSWQVDVRFDGRGSRRVRRRFSTKSEAKRFESHLLGQIDKGKDWNPAQKDNRRLTDLIQIWFNAKGVHLKDGERRKRCVCYIANWLGNPVARNLLASDFLAYRAHKLQEGATGKTLNNHLGYLNAVFNELSRLGEIQSENPLRNIQMIRLDQKELSFLTRDQIGQLLGTISDYTQNPHVHLLVRISLATGARWGEAESLKSRHVQNGQLTFVNTKSGKSRSVPVEAELFEEIRFHLEQHGAFPFSLSAFRRALVKSGIELPKGQSAHVLRHTFASHFIMNGGDLLTLQKVLGHSTINMTMRYAHLSPDHLNEAVLKNPLSFKVGKMWATTGKSEGQKRKKPLKSGA